MSKKKQMILLLAAMILLGLILFAERVTGPVIHLVCGALLVICAVKHTVVRMVRMKSTAPAVRLVDMVLLTALVAVVISGMLLHPLSDVLWIGILHKLSGVIFFLGMIAHVIQHYKINQ